MTSRIRFLPLLTLQANLVDPCIKGTLNVLSSCTRASSMRRVVLTSSCSSIRYQDNAQLVSPLNESNWSDVDYCKLYNVNSLETVSKFWKHQIFECASAHTHIREWLKQIKNKKRKAYHVFVQNFQFFVLDTIIFFACTLAVVRVCNGMHMQKQ